MFSTETEYHWSLCAYTHPTFAITMCCRSDYDRCVCVGEWVQCVCVGEWVQCVCVSEWVQCVSVNGCSAMCVSVNGCSVCADNSWQISGGIVLGKNLLLDLLWLLCGSGYQKAWWWELCAMNVYTSHKIMLDPVLWLSVNYILWVSVNDIMQVCAYISF